jgi:hypothetical protein
MSKEDFSVNGMAKKILSMDEMLAAPDVQFREIEAWGGTVRLGSLTAEEMIEFVEQNANEKARRVAGVRMIIRSLVDEAGARIGKEEHIPLFLKKDAATTNRIVEVVMEMNGLSKPKADAVKND